MDDTIKLQVHLDYDDEAKVWYVAKSDIPGLSMEAPTATALVERIIKCAPELMELNNNLIVDSVRASVNEPRRAPTPIAPRRRMTVLPVFDAPLELARA